MLFLLLTASCKDEAVSQRSDDQWQAGLFDLYVAREAAQRHPVNQQDSILQIYINRIAERMDVTPEAFTTELDEFMDHEPKRFLRLMDSVEMLAKKYRTKQ